MHPFFCLLFSFLCIFCPLEAFILHLFLSLLTSFIIIPLYLSSTASLSSPLSVTHPLFSACCDQLGDISPTDIPGDRTSAGHILLHLSSSCLSLVSPLRTWLSCHSSFQSAPLLFLGRANRAPLLFPPSILSCHPLCCRQWHSLSPPLLRLSRHLSSFSSLLYVLATRWQWCISLLPLCPLCSNSIPPLSFFLSPRLPLSRSLQVAVHNDGPVFPPVCQPFTCILATTSPLALVLHAEQANKTPGEWRTSTLVYPPPSIRSVIPSHVKRRP